MESLASSHLIPLEENLTITAVAPLLENLKSAQDAPVSIDASAVKHLDWPVLQLLISASRAWAAKSLSFEIANISDNFQHGLDTLGVSLDTLSNVETA